MKTPLTLTIILFICSNSYCQSVYDNYKSSNSTYVPQYIPGEAQVKFDYYQTFAKGAYQNFESKNYYGALIDFNKAITGYGSSFARPEDYFFRGLCKERLGYKCKDYCKDLKKAVKYGIKDYTAVQLYQDLCPCKKK